MKVLMKQKLHLYIYIALNKGLEYVICNVRFVTLMTNGMMDQFVLSAILIM